MQFKLLNILACVLLFYSCTKKAEEKNSSMFPFTALEGEKITINLINDSLKLKLKDCRKDSIYLQTIFYNNSHHRKTINVNVINDMVSFVVPKGTIYFKSFFYTVCDKDEKEYTVRIYNEKGLPVPNAFYDKMADTIYLRKEIAIYPNNLSAYSNHIIQLANLQYMGKVTDTLVRSSAEKYLRLMENKVNSENANDLRALSTLYAFAGKYNESQQIILKLYKEHTNSYELDKALSDYWFSEGLINVNEVEEGKFNMQLTKKIAKSYPNSLTGIIAIDDAYEDNIYAHLFSKKDILNNLYSCREIFQGRNFLIQEGIAKINLDIGNLKVAKLEAEKYLLDILNDSFIHYSPSFEEEYEKQVKKSTYIGGAYELLAEVSEADKDVKQATIYLDSAVYFYEQDINNRFKSLKISNVLNKKASIQRKINQHNEALKTYEILYQETKDDRVLDSIKVLFKETEQEKGFESYAKNLKERVKNKNQESKKLAADFSIKDMSGYEIKLSDWKGRVVVLNFWANYCLPCAKEIPFLNKIWRETQTKDIIFLAVTKNTPLEVTRFAQRQKEMFSFSILPNAKELTDVYDVNLVPTQIVINKKGEIVHRESGFNGNIDKLKQVIMQELSK